MKLLKTVITIALSLAILAAACKKKKKTEDPEPGTSYRVSEIQSGTEKKIYAYDNEGRISHIDFNTGSYRFAYTETEISVQVYFANGTPDPSWKYLFTAGNGYIASGIRYLPNGAIGREYTYEYDNQQRLAAAVMSLKDFTGDEAENHRYQFVYDAQSNLQQVLFKRKLKAGSELENADSAALSITYHTEKSFISWKQMGFAFFGKTTAAIEIQGLETIPFSFTFTEKIVPSGKAVKSIEARKYTWNPGNGTWGLSSSDTDLFAESDYEYSVEGLPIRYKNNTVKWESY